MSPQHSDEHREEVSGPGFEDGSERAHAGAAERADDGDFEDSGAGGSGASGGSSGDDSSGGDDDSGGRDSETGGGDGGTPSLDDVDVKDLLRMALDDAPQRQGTSKIAEGVHRKISQASGGRYFADGWSTSATPRATFIVTSLLMLLVVVLAWLVLLPWGMSP
jgi:hypothetical protein